MDHIYPADKMLKVQGSMMPDSLSWALAKQLGNVWRSWTNEFYSDSLSPKASAYQLLTNLRKEIDLGVEDFIKTAMATTNDLPEDFAENCRKLMKIEKVLY